MSFRKSIQLCKVRSDMRSVNAFFFARKPGFKYGVMLVYLPCIDCRKAESSIEYPGLQVIEEEALFQFYSALSE